MTQQLVAVAITERPPIHVDAASRLAALGHIDPATGTTPVAGFDVSINGSVIAAQIAAYEVVAGAGGTQVILTLAADSVTIGKPKPATEGHTASVWGAAGKPDPRERIPGWTPEVARG